MADNGFKRYLQNRRLKSSTIKNELTNLKLFMQWCEGENLPPEACTYNDLLAYTNHLQEKHLSAATINMRLRTLRKYYDHLGKTRNPAAGLKVRNQQSAPQMHLLTPDELEQV